MDAPGGAVDADPRLRFFWRNLVFNLTAELLWGFGIACMAPTTVIAVYLRSLDAPNFLIGLVPIATMAASAVLQIPGALYFRRFPSRKWPFVLFHTPIVVLQVGVALSALLLPQRSAKLAIAAFFSLITAQSLAGGFVWAVWPHMLDRIFPPSRRGRAVGSIGIAFAGSAVAGGLFVHAVLSHESDHPPFWLLFSATAVAYFLSLVCWTPIVELPLSKLPPPVRPLSALRRMFRRGSAWRKLVVARWLTELALSPMIFTTILTISRFSLPASQAGIFQLLSAVGGGAGALLLGWLGDRRGHKSAIVTAGCLLPLGTLLILLAPALPVAYVGFFLLGAVPAGDSMGTLNLVIESAPEEDKGIYTAVVNTAMLPPRLVGPVMAGVAAQVGSPAAALSLAVLLQVISLLGTIFLVAEPRKLPWLFASAAEGEAGN